MNANPHASCIAELRAKLARLPNRPPRGELLARAFEIPLTWPEEEYPEGRSMAEQFRKAHQPWGSKIHLLRESGEVMGKLREIVQSAGARRLSRWLCPRLDRYDWEEGFKGWDVEWIIPTAEDLALAADEPRKRETMLRLSEIELGITDCDLAVAHTGSLVFFHDAARPGYTSLFPWTHVAIVNMSQMVRTLQDAIEHLSQVHLDKPWESNTLFVTGPSRSGDIDLAAGQGAAGPGQFHVLLLESGEGAGV